MIAYDIELCQGDTETVNVVLKSKGVGANLTGATVTFTMINAAGDEFDITCLPGATVDDVSVPASSGGVRIPFTGTHTVKADLFQGKFIVTILGVPTTFPSGRDYVSVRIWEAV